MKQHKPYQHLFFITLRSMLLFNRPFYCLYIIDSNTFRDQIVTSGDNITRTLLADTNPKMAFAPQEVN